ncbi:MAG TPA: hypothetical protein VIS48_02380 [Candidatus Kryptonia bacterium]
MTRKFKVIQVGLGQIGLNIAKALLSHPDKFKLVGCMDNAPDKLHKDLGELLDLKTIYNLPVAGTIGELKAKRASLAFHSTVSFLPDAADQVADLLKHGYNVITTAEELFFLKKRDIKIFHHLDKIAKAKRVRIMATGVDPGYVMDSLVLMLTAPCVEVRSIRAERMINLSRMRLSLQRKLGIGLSKEEFIEETVSGKFGPSGLTDSAEFLASYLDIKYERIRSSVQPIIADHDFHGENIFVAKNHVVGVRQEVSVEKSDEVVISLRLSTRIDASIEYDAINVDGDPPVNVIINNGIMGDTATVGLMLNQAENLMNAPPGYHDMAELPLPHFSMDHFS